MIALMLVRNEDWAIRATLDAALRWCDGGVLLLDRCTDESPKTAHDMLIVRKKPWLMHVHNDEGPWDEMVLREKTLTLGREKLKGTHFAVIDGDEILTHNNLPIVRAWFENLKAGEALDVPMVPVWDDLGHHRVEDPTWSNSWLTLGFADAPGLTWKAAQDGYQHHNRPPHGLTGRQRRGMRGAGGVMHLQFANTRRLVAKHVLYRMVDHLRWPGRESVEQLNWKYDQALKPSGGLAPVPAEWWGDYFQKFIYLEDGEVPYQEEEIKKLLAKHGREAFAGLDLKGW